MSDEKDYGEPWELRRRHSYEILFYSDGQEVEFHNGAPRDRIVACVNACAGMADPSSEIARLRADVERKDEALKEADALVDMILISCPSGLADHVMQFASKVSDKITTALADTADKKGNNDGT